MYILYIPSYGGIIALVEAIKDMLWGYNAGPTWGRYGPPWPRGLHVRAFLPNVAYLHLFGLVFWEFCGVQKYVFFLLTRKL